MKMRRPTALLVAAICCGACLLRAPLSVVGALADVIQSDLALSAGSVGLLTTIPLLAFAASSAFVGRLGALLGKRRLLAAGCGLIAVGLAVRSVGGAGCLFAGTVIMGVGIASGNVLIPAVIKERFPLRIGALTGLYTTLMTLSAAGAAAGAQALREAGVGWRPALAILLPAALVALVLWLAAQREGADARAASAEPAPAAGLAAGAARPAGEPAGGVSLRQLLRTPLTWWIAGLVGIQSAVYYSALAWIPAILAAKGLDPATAILGFTLFTVAGIPLHAVVPPLAAAMRRQRLFGLASGLLCCLSIVLLLVARSAWACLVAVSLIAVSTAVVFTLAVTLFGLRTSDGDTAGELSGVAQAIGYLVAAVGPVMLGALFDATGNWEVSLVALAALAALIALCGWKSGDGVIAPRR